MVMSRSQARSVFFFKQKTAYEMRISDWSSDVCSSDLGHRAEIAKPLGKLFQAGRPRIERKIGGVVGDEGLEYFETDIAKAALEEGSHETVDERPMQAVRPEHILPATQTKCCGGALSDHACPAVDGLPAIERSEEHTSELQSLMSISYAVFCL